MTGMSTLPIIVTTNGPNGGKSHLECGATKHDRNISVTSYGTTISDENHSQLAPTPTGTTAAAVPHRIDPSGDTTDPTPFEDKPLALPSLVDPKSLQSLETMGGTEGLLRGLGTDASLGLRSWQYVHLGQWHDLEKGEGGSVGIGGGTPISCATADDRRRIYCTNRPPSQKGKGLLLWMWSNLKGGHLVFLSVAAATELVLGLYFDSVTPREGVLCDDGMTKCAAPPVDWVEGVVIMIAVSFIVIVGTFNDWQTEGRFCEPSDKNDRSVDALSRDTKHTPLQLKLKALAKLIEQLGYGASIILFTCLMIKAFVWSKAHPDQTANDKAATVLRILIVCVTLTVVAVPEGLSLAVALVLAFSTRRMTREGLLVRVSSWEAMANASVICTDRTGTLTQNVISVIAGSVGIHCKFTQRLSENGDRQDVDRVAEDDNPGRNRTHRGDFLVETSDLNAILHEPLRSLFNEALTINSTAAEDKNPETSELEFMDSQTEAALLRFAKDLKWAPYQQTQLDTEVIQMIPFSSGRKVMGVVVRVSVDKYRFYLKGASEIVTKLCSRHVIVHRPGSEAQIDSKAIKTAPITEPEGENISRTIHLYGDYMLRTLAIAYREFESWPPEGHTGAIDEVPYEIIANDLTLVGIVGIEEPLRPGVKEAVTRCQGAGITVKMCTGDSLATACSIASQCGILTAGGIVMEGPDFCRLSPQKRRETAPHLQVLARSSPEDKRILVDTLKGLGEIVSATGDGTNDGPALKHADVGFSLGVAGTEIAKEAPDIALMSDNFASIVSAIMWGRCIHDSIRKFLQFHVPVNVTALLVTFISAIASDKQVSFLAAIQLLWINIVMGSFAALAFTTDPVSPALPKRMPDRKTAPLFSVDMGKMIIGQLLYQTSIILLLHFVGPKFLGYHTEEHVALSTMVFNTFVFCQIFNLMNCRSLTQDQNIFRGLTKNWCFIVITLIEVMIQILIVSFGGAAFQVTPMDGHEWGMSVALGFVSIPLGFLIRYIPTPPIERLFVALHIMRNPQAEDRDSDGVAHKWGKESV